LLSLDEPSDVTIGLTGDFDTLIRLYQGSTSADVQDDNFVASNDSRLVADLPPGSYVIEIASYSDSGSGGFSLSATGRASDTVQLETVAPGEEVIGSLEASERRLYLVKLQNALKINVLLTGEFDTYLRLYGGTAALDASPLNLLGENDDRQEDNNSSLEIDLPQGSYLIEAGSYEDQGSGAFTLALSEGETSDLVTGEEVLHVPDQFSTIQEAVDAAFFGQIVQIAPGEYDEQVTIYQSLTLLGSGAENTFILPPTDENGLGTDGISVLSGEVNIQGITVKWGSAGIKATTPEIVTIKNCIFTNNDVGIDLASPSLVSGNILADNGIGIIQGLSKLQPPGGFDSSIGDPSPASIIRNNVIVSNYQTGIYALTGNLYNNTIDQNLGSGIEIPESSNEENKTDIRNNIITSNGYFGISVTGFESTRHNLAQNLVWNNELNDYDGVDPGDGDLSEDPFYARPFGLDLSAFKPAAKIAKTKTPDSPGIRSRATLGSDLQSPVFSSDRPLTPSFKRNRQGTGKVTARRDRSRPEHRRLRPRSVHQVIEKTITKGNRKQALRRNKLPQPIGKQDVTKQFDDLGLEDFGFSESDFLPNFDYRLLSGSPAISMGASGFEFANTDGSRNTMGAYGGPHPFDPSLTGIGTSGGSEYLSHSITTVAGTGATETTLEDGTELETGTFSGDNGPALEAGLNFARGVFRGYDGSMFIVDTFNNRIRKVDPTDKTITTVAGTGEAGYSGDGGPATEAALNHPFAVVADQEGNLFIADTFNNRIRKVDGERGTITTVAGDGVPGFTGDDVSAHRTSLSFPTDVTLDPIGNLYIADENNHRIRIVDAFTGLITTIAGNGEAGFSEEIGLAVDIPLTYPRGIAVDNFGNLYIADIGNNMIFGVSSDGILEKLAGTGNYDYSGDGDFALFADLAGPTDLAVDGAGNIYFTDEGNSVIRMINEGRIITTVAGDGFTGYFGDGGRASNASIFNPSGVAIDSEGNLLIADTGNHRIRRVSGIAAPTELNIGVFAFTPQEEGGLLARAGDGSLALDLDTSPGDQGRRDVNGASEGTEFTIEFVYGASEDPVLAAILTLRYDPDKIELVPDSFSGLGGEDVFSAGEVLELFTHGPDPVTLDSGTLGYATFRTLPGFFGETEIGLYEAGVARDLDINNDRYFTPGATIVVRSSSGAAQVVSEIVPGDDPLVGQFIYPELKYYTLDLPGDASLTLDLISQEFDTILRVYRGRSFRDAIIENLEGENDDREEDTSSRLQIDLPAGAYLIEVSSYSEGESGNYSLQASGEVAALSAVDFNGAPTEGSLDAESRRWYTLELTTDTEVEIDLTGEFDTIIRIFSGLAPTDENLVGENDDRGEDSNSHLNLELPAGSYLLEVGSYQDSGSGSFALQARGSISF